MPQQNDSTAASSSAEALPGLSRLGRYEVVARLARGGMGTVYVGRHAGQGGFQRFFALKVMHQHLAEDTEFVQMFLDEARIAAQLHHPNVVSIVDVGVEGQQHYVVMEYVEGCSLSELLRAHKEERPPELLVPILIDLLKGLHAAHSLKDESGDEMHLVHRDVSPQNILIGVDGATRITDFGIAKAEARISSTRPGLRKGKLGYMSPEQLMDRPVDRRSDVFAVGAVMWNSLTGERLFQGDSEGATIHNLMHKEIPKPSDTGLCPPSALDQVCLKALERDPDKRFQSAEEMAEALQQVAIEAGVFGTHSAVAKWVGHTFSDTLDARREAIRSAVEGSLSAQAEMPAVPSIGGTRAGSLTPSSTVGSGASHVRAQDQENAVPVTVELDSTRPGPPSPAEEGGGARSRKRALVLLVLVSVLVAGALAMVGAFESDGSAGATVAEPPSSGSVASEPSGDTGPPRVGSAQEEDDSMDVASEAELGKAAARSGTAENPGSADTDVDTAGAEEEGVERPDRAEREAVRRRRAARRARLRRARAEREEAPPAGSSKAATDPEAEEADGSEKPAEEPKSKAPSKEQAPSPAPEATPEPAFESNPYLRRR